MLIRRTSPFSGKSRVMNIPVTEDQLERWQNGELIQNVMPNLTPDQREFIISGITSEEWDEAFGGDEGDFEPCKEEGDEL